MIEVTDTPRRRDRLRRRNSLIAAAIAVPVTVVVAFALAPRPHSDAGSSSDPNAVLPPLSIAAPALDGAAESSCAQVMSAVPVQLGPLKPRVVHSNPPTALVVAWGDPAVVLACGVTRPSELAPDSAALLININGVNWLPVQKDKQTVFTSIDRAVYVQVTVPKAQSVQPLPLIADAVSKVLPTVCQVQAPGQTAPPQSSLCTRRP